MHYLFIILRTVLLVYVGLSIFLFFIQKRQIYVPSRDVLHTPAEFGLKYEELTLEIETGETISAWFVEAKKPSDVTVLFCHGNGGNNGDRTGTLMAFSDMGFNSMLFDYPGYGKSTGSPNEKNTIAAAKRSWDYLVEDKKILPANINIFGRSLGGAVAIQLAQDVKPRMVVVESTFTSAPDMAALLFPMLPSRWLCRYDYNSRAVIKNITCPVIVAHGKGDTVIPYILGTNLYDAASEPKHFIDLDGGHNYGGLDVHSEYQELFKEVSESSGK